MKEDEVIEVRLVTKQIAERAAQGRGAQLRHPQEPARFRRRRQRPAQGHLPAAQRAAGSRVACRRPSRPSATTWSPTSSRRFVPANSIDEQWDLPGPGAPSWRASSACESTRRLLAEEHDEIDADEHRRSTCWTWRRKLFADKEAQIGAEIMRHAREAPHAQRARPELEGAPGAHGLPAPGHPPARLCAEAAEAGIQARSLRAVHRAAGQGQARSHHAAGARAHPQRRRSRPDGSRRAPAHGSPGRPHAVPASRDRRLRRRRGSRARSKPSPPQAGGFAAARATARRSAATIRAPAARGKKYKQCHGQLA